MYQTYEELADYIIQLCHTDLERVSSVSYVTPQGRGSSVSFVNDLERVSSVPYVTHQEMGSSVSYVTDPIDTG